MTSATKRRLFNLAGVLFSAAFLYFCFHSFDLEDLKQAFYLPRPWFLLLVIPLNVVMMALRTRMWLLLLRPVARVPYPTLFEVIYIGFMTNNILPLKAGDFFRASLASKKWKIPYTQVLTTVGMERFFEGFGLILVFLGLTFFLDIPLWVRTGAYFLGFFLIGVQIFLIILWKKKPNLAKWQKRHPLLYRIFETLSHIGEGSQSVKPSKAFLKILGTILMVWFCQSLMLKSVEMAYGIQLSFAATLFAMIVINLAMAIPSAPGNIGTVQFAAKTAYMFLGLPQAIAVGIGIFFHFLNAIPIISIGLVFYFRWGLKLEDVERMAESKLEEAIS